MKQIMWQPTDDEIKHSNMQEFIYFVNENYAPVAINSYSDLYQWSIAHPEIFWHAIWIFFNIKATQQPTQILTHPNQMLQAKWFLNAKFNFAENLLAGQNDHLAIIYRGENGERRNFTYGELKTLVAKLTNRLREFNVGPHDVVAGLLPNIPETIIAMLATTSIGAIWSSCSPDFGLEAILDRFGQIAPKILFCADGYFYNGKKYSALEKISELKTKLPSLKKIILVPHLNLELAAANEMRLFDDLIANGSDQITFEPLPFDHPAYILYSSGTTGAPKCIVHGAGGTLLQHLKELSLHTNLKKNDVIFYYTTCGWMMWNWYVSSLALGATIFQYDGSPFYPNPEKFFSLIDEEKINVLGISAKYISALEKFNVAPKQKYQLSSLRTILSTGSPLVPQNFDYVYKHIKSNVCLSSISGGTDIISCFALGNPMLPVVRGELQCLGLGMKVQIFNEQGKPVVGEKGELVCTAPFPSMPVFFWNDPNHEKYHAAYFNKYPNVWSHGDYAEITPDGGMIIYGRSDAVLNPGGIRIGTAEIYRQVEKIPEVVESIVVDQAWENDTRIILFVKLRNDLQLDETLKDKIKKIIRENSSVHHVPAKIIQVPDIPRTINNKLLELVVRDIIHERPITNLASVANPECLSFFKNKELFMQKQLNGKKIAILVTDGFEEVELSDPKKALLEQGAVVHIISPKSDKVKAWNHTEWSKDYPVDKTLSEASPNDYDALILPGGVINPDKLRIDEKAVAFVDEFFKTQKPIAAICHGPWTLIETGKVKGKTMTSYKSLKTDLENAGAKWQDNEVVIDEKLITSRGPKDLPAFIKTIVQELQKN